MRDEEITAVELCGGNLKLKYRAPKPKGTNQSKGGNSGISVKSKTVPRGMRKKYKPGAKRYN